MSRYLPISELIHKEPLKPSKIIPTGMPVIVEPVKAKLDVEDAPIADAPIADAVAEEPPKKKAATKKPTKSVEE